MVLNTSLHPNSKLQLEGGGEGGENYKVTNCCMAGHLTTNVLQNRTVCILTIHVIGQKLKIKINFKLLQKPFCIYRSCWYKDHEKTL